MARTINYEGYTIQSIPHQETNGEKWRLHIFISVEDHPGVRTRNSQPRSCMRPSRKPISMGLPLANASLMGR